MTCCDAPGGTRVPAAECRGRPPVWDGEGAPLDFTKRAGIAWWQRGLQREILQTGLDVACNDNNEYAPPTALGECDGFANQSHSTSPAPCSRC
jgi:alpha-glucosidase (family GH31 glycosyl hydrolase)